MEKKKLVSVKNIIIGSLFGIMFVWGLSYVEIKDERTVKLICGGATFLFALFFLFLSIKIHLVENFARYWLRLLPKGKIRIWPSNLGINEDGTFTPKFRLFARIYFLIGCALAIIMGIACLFILK